MVMGDAAVVLLSFAGMEGVSYLAHRFLMHGPGIGWHRSHHAPPAGARWETNDLFPVVFAAGTVLAMAAGTSLPGLRTLFVAGVGVTLYGAAYLFVHELYIHARLGHVPRIGLFERLKDAHRVHHLYGGEPFGMLLPVVPRRLRVRAASRATDPLARPRAPAFGSAPAGERG
ncbi:MAG TPA: sterol desaturase family protein [Acidimicrobiales bacterium]|nr:sterol desaturase family protein [Acidimicrobiales bacterium]